MAWDDAMQWRSDESALKKSGDNEVAIEYARGQIGDWKDQIEQARRLRAQDVRRNEEAS